MEAYATVSTKDSPPFDLKIPIEEAQPVRKRDWEDFIPAAHPDDQRTEIYRGAGKIDEFGSLRLKKGCRYQRFNQEQKRAIQAEWIKNRRFGEGHYSWKEFIDYLHRQSRAGMIPEIDKVVFIGSKFREILETTGYLHRMQERILGEAIDRRDRLYFCHDYDIRVYMKAVSREDLLRVKTAAVGFFNEKLERRAINWRRAGGHDSDFLSYFMLPVQEEGDVDTEWLFIQKISQEYLFTEDRIQGEITFGDHPLPQITLMGTKNEFLQGVVDSDRGVQRFCDAENADYYAWIRMVVNRSFGKVLELNPGQGRGLVRSLRIRTLESKQLPRKVFKSLKGLADHKLCTFWNAFISLKIHGGCEESIEGLWRQCRASLFREEPKNPLLNTFWNWIKTSQATFEDLTIVMQVVALFRHEATVRKDGGVPVLYYDFGESAAIQFPMISQEALDRFRQIVSQNTLPLNELFRFAAVPTLDPFFEQFSDRIGLDGVKFKEAGSKWLDSHPSLGLAFLFMSRLFNPRLALGPIESAPYLIEEAKRRNQQEPVQTMLRRIYDEGVEILPEEDAVDQYVNRRMAGMDDALFLWARNRWSGWDAAKQKRSLFKLFPVLKKQRPEALYKMILALSRTLKPSEGIEILLVAAPKLPDREMDLLLTAVSLSQAHGFGLSGKLMKKLDKHGGSLPLENFEPLPRTFPKHALKWRDMFLRRGGTLVEFLQKYPGIEEEFFRQINESKKLDKELIQFLNDHPRYARQCEPHCRNVFLQSPKVWIQSIEPGPSVELLRMTNRFLVETKNSKCMRQRWREFIQLLRARGDVDLWLDCAEELEAGSSHRQALAAIEIECLRMIQSGTVGHYEAIKRVAERALSISRDGEVLKAWRQAYPAILKAFQGRSLEAMLGYWSRSYEKVGIVEDALSLLTRCLTREPFQELEEYLSGAYLRLSGSDQERVVKNLLPKRIKQKDRDQVLKICRLGETVLGDLADYIQLAVEHERFGLALAFFEEKREVEELFGELIETCLSEGRTLEALALLLRKPDVCGRGKVAFWLRSISSDREVQASSPALWDLLELTIRTAPNAPGIYEMLGGSISWAEPYMRDGVSLIQFFWETAIRKVYHESVPLEKEWLMIFMDLLAQKSPEGLTFLLARVETLKLADDDFLARYQRVLFSVFDRLPPKMQSDSLRVYFSTDHQLANRLVDIDPLPPALWALKRKSTIELGLSLILRMASKRKLTLEETKALIPGLLNLESLSGKPLDVLIHVSSRLILDSKQQCGKVLLIEGIDYPKLFARMFKTYHKSHVKMKVDENSTTFACLVTLPWDYSFWDWFYLFFKAACHSSYPFDDDAMPHLKLFLLFSLQFNQGVVFERFIKEILQSPHCSLPMWNIFIHVIKGYAHCALHEVKYTCELFKQISSAYSKWRGQIPYEDKIQLLRHIHKSVVLWWTEEEGEEQLKADYEWILRLFFEGESALMQCSLLKMMILQSHALDQSSPFFQALSIFLESLLESAFPKFCNRLSDNIELVNAGDKNNLWDSMAFIFRYMLSLGSQHQSMILETFLKVEKPFKAHRGAVDFKTKVSLVTTLLECSKGLLCAGSGQDLFKARIDAIQALCESDPDGNVLLTFGALLPLPPKEISEEGMERLGSVGPYLFEKVSRLVFQTIESVRQRKARPHEYETLLLVNFLSLEEGDEEAIQKARRAFPPSWDPSLIELFHFKEISERISVRRQCLELLESKKGLSKKAALYERLRDDIYQSFENRPGEWNFGLFPPFVIAAWNALEEIKVSSSKKAVKKYLAGFARQVDRMMAVHEELHRRLKAFTSHCESLGVDPKLNATWISSESSDALMMAREMSQLTSLQLMLCRHTFHFFHLSLRRTMILNRSRTAEQLFQTHVIILRCLSCILSGIDGIMIEKSEFVVLITLLSSTYESEQMYEKYAQLIRTALVKSEALDREGKGTETFKSLLTQLSQYSQNLGVLKLAGEEVQNIGKRRISKFVQFVFASLKHDFKEKLEVIGEIQKLSTDPEVAKRAYETKNKNI